MNLQDWFDAGYRRYNQSGSMVRNADFIMQKRLDDEVGKRYFITVYCFDYSRYPDDMRRAGILAEPYGFTPEVRFEFDEADRPFVTISMDNMKATTVAEVEEFFEKMWATIQPAYYEKWPEEVTV